MKFISGLFKFVAVLIMLFVIVGMPAALLGKTAGDVIFSSDKAIKLVTENLLDHDVMSKLAFEVVQTITLAESAGPLDGVVLEGVKNLTEEDWGQLLRLIAPPDLVVNTVSEVLEGYYAWLDSGKTRPEISIDTRPWKDNFSRNSVDIAELVMGVLPACSANQLGIMQVLDFALGGDVPLCRPSEPIYSTIIEQVSVIVPARMDNVLDQIDFTGGSLVSAERMLLIKARLRQVRLVMRFSWMVAGIMFLIAIPLGARSLNGYFNWFSWPILLVGGITLLITLALLFFSEGIIGGVSSYLLANYPRRLSAPFEAFIMALLSLITRPLLIQSVGMLVIGGGGLVSGAVLGRLFRGKNEQESSEAQAAPQPDQPEGEGEEGPPGMFG